MKLKYAIMVLALLAMPFAQASIEKPHWSVGDYWEYTGSYSIRESIAYENYTFDLDISTQNLQLKVDVVDVEIKTIEDNTVACYKTEVEATADGALHVETNFFGSQQSIDGTFTIEATGNIYFTTKNLSMVSNENDIYLNLTTDIPIPNLPSGRVEVAADYNPPLDFLNFPISKGETWEASSYATLYYGETPTSGPVSFSFECTSESGDECIIQSTFNPFGDLLMTDENIFMFWSEKVGMLQQIMNAGGNQTLNIQLSDYSYEGKENIPPKAKISFEPVQPKVGTNIFFKSESTDTDGNIVSWHWDFGDDSSSNQQSPSHKYTKAGTYTVTLTVMDNYGNEDSATVTLTIESSGGGSTPGFEMIFAFIAILLIVTAGKKRLGNFK
ncbi:MAG: PKD domain-containing protein [Thermoplasmata archaeon]|nr:MAG: PKD domain-containing protein [Thermoplasmata archaeon]RLF33754.1 MAG: hypothetical protein DRN07_01710 [Thermoplasmata archaeon]